MVVHLQHKAAVVEAHGKVLQQLGHFRRNLLSQNVREKAAGHWAVPRDDAQVLRVVEAKVGVVDVEREQRRVLGVLAQDFARGGSEMVVSQLGPRLPQLLLEKRRAVGSGLELLLERLPLRRRELLQLLCGGAGPVPVFHSGWVGKKQNVCAKYTRVT